MPVPIRDADFSTTGSLSMATALSGRSFFANP